jgi:uncharacterized protein YbcI
MSEDQCPTFPGLQLVTWPSRVSTECSLFMEPTLVSPPVNSRVGHRNSAVHPANPRMSSSSALDSGCSLRLWVFIFLRPFAVRLQRERTGAVMADPSTDTQQLRQPGGWLLQDVSNAMVALHKEQFGRGPTRAQSHLAGADALICVMDDALLPAEWTMVEMGEQQRVRESRMFLQVATADQFIATVEKLTGRHVRAFASATDPDRGVVVENFIFEPEHRRDGRPPPG